MSKMTSDEICRERKKFFNAHAEQWVGMWYKDHVTGSDNRHQKDFERLFSLLMLKPGDHVLDAGCGTGVLAPYLLERITAAGLLYELDYAERMMEINQALHKQDNIRFIVSEVEEAPLAEASCDAIICFSCFPHFQDKGKALSTLARILKPRGVLVVSHFDSAEGINRHHGSCRAVMHDRLPDKTAMYSLMERAGLVIGRFIEEQGFYCIVSGKEVR